MYFGALVGGLGCFPFDDGTYLSPSHCQVLTLWVFGVYFDLVRIFSARTELVLYPL